MVVNAICRNCIGIEKNKAFSCVYLIKNYVKKLSKCWKIDSSSLYILEKQGIFSLDSVKK